MLSNRKSIIKSVIDPKGKKWMDSSKGRSLEPIVELFDEIDGLAAITAS